MKLKIKAMMIIMIFLISIVFITSVSAKQDNKSMLDNVNLIKNKKDWPVKDKIHWKLQEEIDNEKKSNKSKISETNEVDVLIRVDALDDLESVYKDITARGYAKEKMKLGKVVSARIPVTELEIISKSDKIKSIWPDQISKPLLNISAPQINTNEMWDLGYDGSGIKIAFIDSGIDSDHPDFTGRIIAENDFVPSVYITTGGDIGDGDDDSIAQEGSGHGTHCAGIAAGNGTYFRGIAPGADLIIAKVFGKGGAPDSWTIAAINWAVDPDGNNQTDDGADIISMSLGHPGTTDGPLNQAIRDAIAQGVVVVIASGNEGYGVPNEPANTKEAIAVGAVDTNNDWASFSSGYNFGDYIKPDVVAPGVGIISTRANGTDMYGIPSWLIGNYYARAQGTSMAAPHVSGAVALLLESNPSLTPAQVKEILELTAIEKGPSGKDIMYGSGIIDIVGFIPDNINKFINYYVHAPENVYQDELINLMVNVSIPELVHSIDVQITLPNGTENLSLNNISGNVWQNYYTNTSQLGRYDFNIIINEVQGSTSEFQRSVDVIKQNLSKGVINSITSPSLVSFNTTFPVQVEFQNIANISLETVVEVMLFDPFDNLLESATANVTTTPGENRTFNFNLSADHVPGNYKLEAVASFEGNYHIKDKLITIIDNSSPVIEQIRFSDRINVISPFIADIIVDDLSVVNGTLTITDPSATDMIMSLISLQRPDVKQLAGTYLNTTLIGNYSFFITICDSAGLCTNSSQYSFEVVSCLNKKILVVQETELENASVKYFNILSAGYCLSLWDIEKSGTPSLDYTSNFAGIIWTTGLYKGYSVDSASAILLEQYMDNHGALVIEGPDVAFRHSSDSFMHNVTHNLFQQEVDTKNYTDVDIELTHPHIIFKGLPDVVEYNTSLCTLPDELYEFNGGTALAQWSVNGTSIVGYNDGNSKMIFFPFILEAFENKDLLISNIGEWIAIDSDNPDVNLINITHDYLIEGAITLNIELENLGSSVANNFKVDIYLDGSAVPIFTQIISLTPGQSAVIPMEVSPIGFGNHSVFVTVNDDYSIEETNYMNNAFKKSFYVATTEADLVADGFSYSYDENSTELNVSVNISNIGGTNADSSIIEVNVEDNQTNSTLTVDYGKQETLTSTFNIGKGIYLFETLINPLQLIIESDYANNGILDKIYLCSKESILIVSDDTGLTFTVEDPESADYIRNLLRENHYCTMFWSILERGPPTLDDLNDFDIVIWSTGNYWDKVVNDTNVAVIEQYTKGMWFEGSEIGFDHRNDSFMMNLLKLDYDTDVILNASETLVSSNHSILEGVTSLEIDSAKDPFPDSVIPISGDSVAEWSDDSSVIVANNESTRGIVYTGFSLNGIIDNVSRDQLTINIVEWLLSIQHPCNWITCDDTCDGFTWKANGTCTYDGCIYDTVEENSTICGYCPPTNDCDGDGFIGLLDCNDNDSSVLPPYDGLVVNKSITLCPGTYNLVDNNSDGIFIVMDSTSAYLDCNGTEIIGTGIETAISILGDFDFDKLYYDTDNLTKFDSLVGLNNTQSYINELISNSTFVENITLANCKISNVAQAVNISAAKNISINNLDVDDVDIGIFGMLVLESDIKSNRIQSANGNDNIKGAIILLAANTTLDDNTLSDSGAGIGLIGFSNDLILNNLYNNALGIGLSGYYNEISTNAIHDNNIGVIIVFAENNTLQNNIIENNADTGLFMMEIRNNSVSNNEILGNKKGISITGLFTEGPSENNYFIDNQIIDNTEVGIYISDWTFVGGLKNLFKLIIAQFGIISKPTTSPWHTIRNNEFSGNNISSSAKSIIVDEKISGNVFDNIIIRNTFDNGDVSDESANIYCLNGTGNTYIGGSSGPVCLECVNDTDCVDYCDGTTLYNQGICNMGSCEYSALIENSTECGYAEPVCYEDIDCGNNTFVGDSFCLVVDEVHQTLQNWTCNDPGLSNASCSLTETNVSIEVCDAGFECYEGVCDGPVAIPSGPEVAPVMASLTLDQLYMLKKDLKKDIFGFGENLSYSEEDICYGSYCDLNKEELVKAIDIAIDKGLKYQLDNFLKQDETTSNNFNVLFLLMYMNEIEQNTLIEDNFKEMLDDYLKTLTPQEYDLYIVVLHIIDPRINVSESKYYQRLIDSPVYGNNFKNINRPLGSIAYHCRDLFMNYEDNEKQWVLDYLSKDALGETDKEIDTYYATTHSLFYLFWMYQQDCIDQKYVNLAAEATLFRNKLGTSFSDRHMEGPMTLLITNNSDKVRDNWIPIILENQNDDGGWSLIPELNDSHLHATGVALVTLTAYKEYVLNNKEFNLRIPFSSLNSQICNKQSVYDQDNLYKNNMYLTDLACT